jgi:hypothetical protein
MRVIDKVAAYAALAATLSGLGLLGTLPAQANTYGVAFDGANFDLNAVITTLSTPDSLGGYDITNIQGSVTALNAGVTGGTITGLAPNPLPSGTPPAQGTYYDSNGLGWNYDDVLFTNGQPVFDNNGPLFSFQTSGGIDILANLYSVGSQFYLSVDNPTGLWNPGDPGTLQVSATPVPAALPLFATGLGAAGLLFWRRKRNAVALTAA